MGMDISQVFIVGIPLLGLGVQSEESEDLQLTDHFGKPTGETVTKKELYLTTPNGKRLMIGSNEENLNSQFRRDQMRYYLREDECSYAENIFDSCSEGSNLEDTFIGYSIPALDTGKANSRFDSYKLVDTDGLNLCYSKTAAFLQTEFGYTGDLYIVAMPYISV